MLGRVYNGRIIGLKYLPRTSKHYARIYDTPLTTRHNTHVPHQTRILYLVGYTKFIIQKETWTKCDIPPPWQSVFLNILYTYSSLRKMIRNYLNNFFCPFYNIKNISFSLHSREDPDFNFNTFASLFILKDKVLRAIVVKNQKLTIMKERWHAQVTTCTHLSSIKHNYFS